MKEFLANLKGFDGPTVCHEGVPYQFVYILILFGIMFMLFCAYSSIKYIQFLRGVEQNIKEMEDK